jgi:serine/threonine protein kinase
LTYQLLSGRVPFPRESAVATIFAHLNVPPPRLAKVPAPLADAVQRAMAKRPGDRFASAGDFARAVITAATAEEDSGIGAAAGHGDRPIASGSEMRDVGSQLERSGDPLTVFINYRADDTSGAARFLSERLQQRFGPHAVALDIDLEPWMDRLSELRSDGKRGGVFLVLIGPNWSTWAG